MAIGPLRVPVRVADHYVRPGDEQRLFPSHPYFLTLDEVLEVWPAGLITHEKFQHANFAWRLAKRPMAQGNAVYMAVLDDANGHQHQHANGGSPWATPDMAHRLRSMPLDVFSSNDGSDITGACTDVAPAYAPSPAPPQSHVQAQASALHHVSSAPPQQLAQHSHPPPRSGSLVQLAGRERANGWYSSTTNALYQPQQQQSGGGTLALALPLPPCVSGNRDGGGGGASSSGLFMTDLLAATENPMPLDRYKAFIRLFSGLTRARESLSLPPAKPSAAAAAMADAAWDSPDALDLVKQMLMVGECLAKFGTAELMEARNNSSRAITTRDYAKLLRMYLEGHGAVFRDDFIGRLPLQLQDEALTVRTLLQTRCETNDMLFNQLVKHVGQEPAGGGAVVFNNSSVSANPTNHMLAAPKTLVNTVSSAWNKADVRRRTQLGALGAVAVVALWVVKRRLFGGGGGGGEWASRGRPRRGDDSDWAGERRRRSSRVRGDLPSRLLDERSHAERMAVRFISACQEELRRSQANDRLLRNDWRLGPLRLAPPGSGPLPDGYEPVQTGYCSLGAYVNALDGGMPYGLMPYERPYDGRSAAFKGGEGGLAALPAAPAAAAEGLGSGPDAE